MQKIFERFGVPWRRQSPRRTVRAFTLVEVMISTAILAVSITGVLTLASHGFIVMGNAREFSRANQIAQQKMEDIRLLSFSAIGSLPSTFYDPSDTSHRYAGTISQTPYRTGPDGNVVARKVTVTVTWTGRDGKTRSQSLTAVFTSGGLNDCIF